MEKEYKKLDTVIKAIKEIKSYCNGVREHLNYGGTSCWGTCPLSSICDDYSIIDYDVDDIKDMFKYSYLPKLEDILDEENEDDDEDYE